ncbi:hypothetical protein C8R43DRAFT_1241294 [Mycena crocata]|nr:hypothetical protein C8R43DRAFT_1241294 [Mycena crocata]
MESPFTPHFDTNYVPSDEEVKYIQTDLLFHSTELARLDDLIAQLSLQRQKIQTYIDAHKALISYARRLPHDIVQEIFLACLPTDVNANICPQNAPQVLCRICSAWRAVALSTPRLWASLLLPVEFILDDEQRRAAVSRWMKRSGACPISLSIVASPASWQTRVPGPRPNDIASVMDSLVDSAARWRQVELARFPSEAGLQALTEVSTPILEDLKVGCHRLDNPLRWNMFESPRLRNLALSASIGLGAFILDMPVGWANLTNLLLECTGSSSQGMSPFTVLSLLKRCPNLVSFRFSMSDVGEVLPLEGPVVLPLLHTFAILAPCNVLTQNIGDLMAQLVMPELRNLYMPRRYPRRPHHQTSFLAPLATRSPLLKTLTIDMGCFTESVLIESLQALSSLTRLVVTDSPTGMSADTEQLLVALTPTCPLLTPKQSIACPVLEDLSIHGCRILSDDLLLSFIQQRTDLCEARLRRLAIEYEGSKPGVDLVPFRERGLEVLLYHSP